MIAADFNNDGLPDIYVSGCCGGPTANHYYQNQGAGQFAAVDSGAFTAYFASSHGTTAADYDQDGFLDVFVSNYGSGNTLFRNQGNGLFSPVNGVPSGTFLNTFGANWVDYDEDGRPDIFLVNYDNQPCKMYRNLGNGNFSEVAVGDLTSDAAYSKVAAFADFDNDGDLDVIVTNGSNGQPVLYRNDGGVFTHLPPVVLGMPNGEFSGVAWGDYDNDGFADLVLTGTSFGRLLRNRGDGTFELVVNSPVTRSDIAGGSASWADYDHNGFLDLFIGVGQGGNNLLFRNLGNQNHWLRIRCLTAVGHRDAIGAKVRVIAQIDGATVNQRRDLTAGRGYLGEDEPIAHFGLGDASVATTIEITWPSGVVQYLDNVAGDQVLTVDEPSQLVPVIYWPTPAAIAYGTPLGAAQLNATVSDPNTGASVAGNLVYSPAAGTVLSPGNGQTLSVTFTPTNSLRYAAATTTVTINVNPAATSVNLSASANPVQLGHPVTFVATLQPVSATGSVRFLDGTTPLGTVALSQGQASLTTSSLGLGTHSIQAVYDGNSQYTGSSATLTETVKPTVTVSVHLLDALGNPLANGSAQYYSAGSWHPFGLTGPEGIVTVELMPGSYSFSLDYAFGRNQKAQNISSNATVVFQTVRAIAQLQASTGSPLLGGKAQYYASGSWHDIGLTDNAGVASAELLPASYAFSMDYGYGRLQQNQNIGAAPTVVFQTIRTTIQLHDSLENPLAGGKVQYYAGGGWHDIGLTDGTGMTSAELLPASYAFSMNYGFGRLQQNQNVGASPTVVFQTTRTTIQLRDSLGNPLAGGKSQYYAGGAWHDVGLTDGSGAVGVELLAANYTFSMDYAYGRLQQTQDIGTMPNVLFQTTRAVVRLASSAGDPLAGGKAKYYASGAWRDIGLTDNTGAVSVELLAATYPFNMDYAFGLAQKNQDIASGDAQFQTGRIHSTSSHCTQYYSSGWRTFTNDMDLLPLAFTFKFNDGTANTSATVVAGTVTNIH